MQINLAISIVDTEQHNTILQLETGFLQQINE